MATVTFNKASRLYPGSLRPAVDELSIDIADGEFLVLVGPSGCGKSTSLRMVAGLEPVTSGRVLIAGEDMKGVRPRDRDVAVVFQSYALYPNMTVADNMAFALQNQKMAKNEIARRVSFAADMLQLEDLLDRRPGQLSGGQRQRVAMGRAIVREPRVFCMDEPLSNLDAKLRVATRAQIASLQRRLGTTTIYVTHDQVEAMTMADRVAVLNLGVLQQVDSPTNLYSQPCNMFVAGFIGSPAITFITCPVTQAGAVMGSYVLPLPASVRSQAGSHIVLGIRPESWVPAIDGAGICVRADLVEHLGSESYVYAVPTDASISYASGQSDGREKKESSSAPSSTAQASTTQLSRIAVHLPKGTSCEIGDTLTIAPLLDEVLYFDPDTTLAINA